MHSSLDTQSGRGGNVATANICDSANAVSKPRGRLPWVAIIVSAISVLLLGWRTADSLNIIDFPDESVNILGAQVIQTGGLLYRDFIDSHGPVMFMISHLYGAIFGWSNPNYLRLVSPVLTLIAGVAVAMSPGLRIGSRLYALCAFAGLLYITWQRQAFYMASFYPVSGALATIALACFVIGAWRPNGSHSAYAFFAGVALGLLAATSYSFWPTVLLFVISGVWPALRYGHRKAVAALFGGLATSVAVTIIYLGLFGDIRGYLAFHIAENQFYFAHYVDFSFYRFLTALVPTGQPRRLVLDFAILSLVIGWTIFAVLEVGNRGPILTRCGPTAVCVVGILLLNARGETDFKNGSFVYVAIAFFAFALGQLVDVLPERATTVLGLCLLPSIAAAGWILEPALWTPFNKDGAWVRDEGPGGIGGLSNAPAFDLIRSLVAPGERILVLPYDPWVYLSSGRLPMNGLYAYFPWDADYARGPWFGRPRDLCSALVSSPPPIIVFANRSVWGYEPGSYMPCLFDIVRGGYLQAGEQFGGVGYIFVRRDRAK